MAQEYEVDDVSGISQKVLEVLFATEDGFAVPEDAWFMIFYLGQGICWVYVKSTC